MDKNTKKIIIGIFIALITTLFSRSMTSIGFMGGQIYMGFPIHLRIGYVMTFPNYIYVAMLNSVVYISVIFVIDYINILIKIRK